MISSPQKCNGFSELTSACVCSFFSLYHWHTQSYIPTVSLSAGQSRFRTICLAVPLSVHLSRLRTRENVKKMIGFYPSRIPDCWKALHNLAYFLPMLQNVKFTVSFQLLIIWHFNHFFFHRLYKLIWHLYFNDGLDKKLYPKIALYWKLTLEAVLNRRSSYQITLIMVMNCYIFPRAHKPFMGSLNYLPTILSRQLIYNSTFGLIKY